MKRKILIVITVLIIASAMSYLLRRGEDEAIEQLDDANIIGTIVSDDGLASIKIREGSLPDNMSINDIYKKREERSRERIPI